MTGSISSLGRNVRDNPARLKRRSNMKTNKEPEKDKNIRIPVEYENCAGKNVVIGDGWADVTFKKSDNTLRFESMYYSMSEISDFNDTETAFDATAVEHAIVDELRKTDKTSEGRVVVKLYENGKDDLLNKLSSNAVDEWYKTELENAAGSTDAAARFVYRLGNVAFDQDMTPLEIQDPIRQVVISSDSGAPQTYYTRFKRENGYRVWYKAVDPIGWFGQRRDDSERKE